jgi:hypothetical protein
MKQPLAILAAALFALTPCAAQSASPMSSATTTMGVGSHGYDFLIGTWMCKNSMPSPMGGPSETTLTVARSVNGALSFHVTAANFAAMGYIVYDAKTKTWWNPSVVASGGYGTESSQQTGKKTVWSGPFTDSSGKTTQVRDTYTLVNSTTYTDLFQISAGGSWKTEGNTTCTKM